MARERDDTGQYVETVGLEDVFDVFDNVRGPVVTSSDVADALDCTTEAARQKLTRLYDRGMVDKRKSGRTTIYWRTDDSREVPTSSPDSEEKQEAEGESEPDTDPLEARMVEVLESFDVTGRGAETQEVRRTAIRHAWENLRDRGEATTQELANSAFDKHGDHPKFGYSASQSHYRGYTFWDSCAREVMKELPGVEAPPQRGNTWRFVDGENE